MQATNGTNWFLLLAIFFRFEDLNFVGQSYYIVPCTKLLAFEFFTYVSHVDFLKKILHFAVFVFCLHLLFFISSYFLFSLDCFAFQFVSIFLSLSVLSETVTCSVVSFMFVLLLNSTCTALDFFYIYRYPNVCSGINSYINFSFFVMIVLLMSFHKFILRMNFLLDEEMIIQVQMSMTGMFTSV